MLGRLCEVCQGHASLADHYCVQFDNLVHTAGLVVRQISSFTRCVHSVAVPQFVSNARHTTASAILFVYNRFLSHDHRFMPLACVSQCSFNACDIDVSNICMHVLIHGGLKGISISVNALTNKQTNKVNKQMET